ncbi:HigA family addiction module antitoxin [Cellulomonas hominis]
MSEKLYGPVHPGEILREEFLEPLGISAYRLAQATGLSQMHVSQILRGKRAITPQAGLRLSKALGLSERYWLNAQTRYDIEIEHDLHAATLDKVEVLVHAA